MGRRGAVRLRGVDDGAPGWGFARHYDLAERVLPAEVLAREVTDDDAVRALVLRAATALGVGTEADIRDYFRLGATQVKPAISKTWWPPVNSNLSRSTAGAVPTYLRAGPDRAADRSRHGAAVPVRPAHLLPASRRAPVQFPLPR